MRVYCSCISYACICVVHVSPAFKRSSVMQCCICGSSWWRSLFVTLLCSLIFQDDTHRGADMFYRGELRLGLLYTPGEKESKKGTLTILVRQAKELPKMDPNGLANAVVKCYLLPDKSSSGKRKTGVIKNNLNPVWEEQFTYKVTLEELSRERVLEVTVWDFHKQGNDFIGGLRLGPAPGRASKHKEWMDSIGEEISHWEAMLAHPGEWVEQWHTLRTTMDPRKVDISSVPLPSLSEPPADTDEVMEPPSSWLPPQQPSPSSYPSEDEFRKVKRPTSQPTSPQTQGDSKTLFGSKVTTPSKHEAPTQTSKVDENISESLFGGKETVRTHPTPVLRQPSPPRTPSPVQSGRSTPEKGIMSSTPAIQVDRETQPGRPESIAISRSSFQDSLEGQEEAHTSQMKVCEVGRVGRVGGRRSGRWEGGGREDGTGGDAGPEPAILEWYSHCVCLTVKRLGGVWGHAPPPGKIRHSEITSEAMFGPKMLPCSVFISAVCLYLSVSSFQPFASNCLCLHFQPFGFICLCLHFIGSCRS